MVAATISDAARLAPRPDKGLPFADALDDAMREHQAVFAALAESERQDREAETGPANIRRGMSI